MWEIELSGEAQILIFTDDIDFYLQLNYIFEKEGLDTHLICSSDKFSERSPEQKTDVIILDNSISDDFAKRIGETIGADSDTREAPVIVLMRDRSKLIPLEPFAQQTGTYTSPVVPETIIERVRLCIDAANAVAEEGQQVDREVRYGDVEMNLSTYRVRRGDRDIHLSPIEFKLLRHFLERPEKPVSRDELKAAVWDDRIYVEPRTVDVHIGRLRRALAGRKQHSLIRTIRSVGYVLCD